MPTFGRWQVSGEPHDCHECGKPIAKGDIYMRLGFVDTAAWRNSTRGRDLKNDPIVMKALFAIAIRKGYPILKIHRLCWHAGAHAPSATQASQAVLSRRTASGHR